MRIRPVILIPAALGALALGWTLRDHNRPVDSHVDTAGGQREHQRESAERPAPPSTSEPKPVTLDSRAVDSDAPVDAAARAQFNEQAREFFARASGMAEEERLREAQQLAQELARLERAGGTSAGEALLLRVGLIRETVLDPAQQAEQIKAVQERYSSETRRRIAEASARPDPAFELYKVRESEIIAEVMSMQTFPDGLTRDEYLRRRLQAEREQLTP